MKFSSSILGAAVAVALSAAALPAAAVTYTLNNGGSAFSTPGTYGTVTLNQVGTSVSFSVVINDPYDFVNTGNPTTSHAAFTFNASGVVVGDISAISMGGASETYAATAPSANSPFGSFGFGIYASSGCSGNCPASGPLTFTVANATISDFLSQSSGGINAYFAADIIGAGVTGAVGVTNITTPVPEPGTYALMFAGLGVVGYMARRRRQS